MKKILQLLPMTYAILLCVLCTAVLITSCASEDNSTMGKSSNTTSSEEVSEKKNNEDDTKACIVLKGEHKLFKNGDGKYLRITKESDRVWCYFLWETNDNGMIASNKLYYSEIRFKLDETVTEPYVKFRWNRSNSYQSTQTIMDKKVIYALIVTNDINSMIDFDRVAEK